MKLPMHGVTGLSRSGEGLLLCCRGYVHQAQTLQLWYFVSAEIGRLLLLSVCLTW